RFCSEENNKAKQITATYALADPDMQFAVGDEVNAQGELRVAPKKFAESIGKLAIDKSKVTPGVTYAMIPVNKDEHGNIVYIPAPMQSMRPKDYVHIEGVVTSDTTKLLKDFADNTVDSVVSAVDIFINRKSLNAEQNRIVTALKNNGYDVTTVKGLKKYVNNFFYTFDNIYDLDDDKVGGPLRAFLRDSPPGNNVLNISEFYIGYGETGTNENVYLARILKGGDVLTHAINVNDNELKKNNRIETKQFLDGLRSNIKGQFLRTNLNNLNTKKKFSLPFIIKGDVKTETWDDYNHYVKHTLRSDVMGFYDEKNQMYYYGIQPIIETDTDYLSTKKNRKTIEDILKSVNDGQIPDEIAAQHKEKSTDTIVINTQVGEWELVELNETKTLLKPKYKKGDEVKELKIKFKGKTQTSIESEIRDQLIDITEEEKTSDLSEDTLNILDNFEESEYTDDFDSIKRNNETDKLEVRYGVRVNKELKKHPKARYKEILAKLVSINKDLAEKFDEYKAHVVKIRDVNNREYYGIEIYRLEYATGNIFDSFKRTKGKTAKETFGKTIAGDIYIADLPLSIQNSVVESIASLFLDNMRRAEDVSGSEALAVENAVKKQYEDIQRYITELTVSLKKNPNKKVERVLGHMMTISNSYDALANMAIRSLSATNIVNAREFKVSIVENKPKIEHLENKELAIEELQEQET
ncbi:hypothetical protein LCGC14_2076420, partial [marine sediment metagenome]